MGHKMPKMPIRCPECSENIPKMPRISRASGPEDAQDSHKMPLEKNGKCLGDAENAQKMPRRFPECQEDVWFFCQQKKILVKKFKNCLKFRKKCHNVTENRVFAWHCDMSQCHVHFHFCVTLWHEPPPIIHHKAVVHIFVKILHTSTRQDMD